MKGQLFIIMLCCFFKSFSQERDLNFYVTKASDNSPLLKDIANQIKSNSIDSLLYKAGNKPQITGSLNANYAPVLNGYGYDTALSNGQSVSGLIGINQRIFGKGQINSQLETFRILQQSLILNKRIAAKDINKAVISQYITAYISSEQIFYNEKMLTLLKEEAAILKKLTQNSIYKQTDYLVFYSTLKQQELQLLQLKQQYQNDLGLLNYLSGETDTTSVVLKRPELTIKTLKSDKSLFEKQFEADSIKIKNQNKLIDNLYKPSLSLLGDAGYMSSLTYQAHKNFGFSVGLGLSIPIYDGNQRALQYKKNEAALATNRAYKDNFNKQYQQQLLMLNQKLKQASEIDNQLQSQLQIADALIEANKKLLLSGDAQITDFVIAISNVVAINNNISQNKINTLQTINEINYWSANE